jgi:predicted SnoaL-like aldol condensation-catalyzing enzyme
VSPARWSLMMLAACALRPGVAQEPVVAVLADDDLVTVVMPREYPDPRREGASYTSTWFYLWPVVDGKLDEPWAPATVAPRE